MTTEGSNESFLKTSEYTRNSMVLRDRIGRAIAQRPIKPGLLADLVGKKTLERKGILEKRKDYFQEAATTPSPDGGIQSAVITTRIGRGETKIKPDSHIDFTNDGATITTQETETDAYGLVISREATVNQNGAVAEIKYSNINTAWNGWNRSTAKSWKKSPEIIKNPNESGKDTLRVSVVYDQQGNLKTAVLNYLDQPAIDLMDKFPSPEDIEKIRKEKSVPSKPDLLTRLNGKKLQNESNYFDIDLGKFLIRVFPGVFVPSKEQASEMQIPEGAPPFLTLRFRPTYKEGINKYDGQYPEILTTLGIYPKLYPPLEEIAKKGFVERDGIIGQKYFFGFNMDDQTAELERLLVK